VFHDLRKEGQVKGTYYSYCILREYCHRLDLNFELARNALPEEIQECMLLSGVKRALKAKEYAEVMRRRKDEVLFVITHDDLQEVYGKDALSIRDKETRINVEKNLSEFQGLAANPGRVRGIARVCLGADEANRNIKEGDILVTGMTMPEYAPAMRKAAAIITDEGGLTCHAAIISRELGKPCMVGTKIGTRILKDGAAIEVNANHGIVKILEQTHNV
jgi:pyruvate,water dikinase